MRVVRHILLALLFSLLAGLAFGTWIRLRLERPTFYLGAVGACEVRVADSGAGQPLDLGNPRAAVLDPRQREEQIG